MCSLFDLRDAVVAEAACITRQARVIVIFELIQTLRDLLLTYGNNSCTTLQQIADAQRRINVNVTVGGIDVGAQRLVHLQHRHFHVSEV